MANTTDGLRAVACIRFVRPWSELQSDFHGRHLPLSGEAHAMDSEQ